MKGVEDETTPAGYRSRRATTRLTRRGRLSPLRGRFATLLVLLVLLVLLIAVPPTLVGPLAAVAWFDGAVSAAVLAVVVSLAIERRQRLFALLSGVPALACSLGGWAIPHDAAPGLVSVGRAAAALFLFGSAVLTVRTLFLGCRERLDAVFGCVCGYLFLGLGWAVLYVAAEELSPGSFRDAADPSGVGPHALTYYSLITLATVGYGDVIPVSPLARSLAWLEAVTGQFYLAVIVAGLVANFGRSAGGVRGTQSEAPD